MLQALRLGAAADALTGVTRSELKHLTGLPTRSLGRILAALLDANQIVRLGKGPATAYGLPSMQRNRDKTSAPQGQARIGRLSKFAGACAD